VSAAEAYEAWQPTPETYNANAGAEHEEEEATIVARIVAAQAAAGLLLSQEEFGDLVASAVAVEVRMPKDWRVLRSLDPDRAKAPSPAAAKYRSYKYTDPCC